MFNFAIVFSSFDNFADFDVIINHACNVRFRVWGLDIHFGKRWQEPLWLFRRDNSPGHNVAKQCSKQIAFLRIGCYPNLLVGLEESLNQTSHLKNWVLNIFVIWTISILRLSQNSHNYPITKTHLLSWNRIDPASFQHAIKSLITQIIFDNNSPLSSWQLWINRNDGCHSWLLGFNWMVIQGGWWWYWWVTLCWGGF